MKVILIMCLLLFTSCGYQYVGEGNIESIEYHQASFQGSGVTVFHFEEGTIISVRKIVTGTWRKGDRVTVYKRKGWDYWKVIKTKEVIENGERNNDNN